MQHLKVELVKEASVSGLPPPYGSRMNPSTEVTGSEPNGFSGICETTLTDWIQLVQMGRRDAIMSLRTPDGKQGTLWCQDGDIIDAACDGLAGEEAVYRALSWEEGRVTVAFVMFQHQRQIQTATSGLLLGAAYRKDASAPALKYLQGAPSTGPPNPTQATSALAVAAGRPGWRKRVTGGRLAVAGGLVTLALLAGPITGQFWTGPRVPPKEVPRSEHLIFADPLPARGIPLVRAAIPPERAADPVPADEQPAAQAASIPKQAGAGRLVARRRSVVATPEPTLAATAPTLTGAMAAEMRPVPAPANTNERSADVHRPRVKIIDDRTLSRIQIVGEREPYVDVVD